MGISDIIFQLKCIKEHLGYVKTEYNPVNFDIKVLESCISQLEMYQPQKFGKVINNSLLEYGTVAEYRKCSVHFDIDSKGGDIFLIKDLDGNIIGKFVEV